ncbi:hypothetical protein MMC15_007176 [Xylographa vitiligo]|nr:hypothetical protein [Xylographa vitiligo]
MIDSILPFVLAHALLGYGLAYLPPASPLRRLSLLLITLCCLTSVQSTFSQRVPGLIGNEYIIGFILHASNFLNIARLSPPPHAAAKLRLRWVLNQLFDARWGAKYIPPFDVKNPNAVPSKRAFLLIRSSESACLLLFLYVVQQYPLNIVPQDFSDVSDGILHRLHSITIREAVIRVYTYMTSTIVPYCTLRLAHSLASIVAIFSGDVPARWPPLFGSLGDAYTVRRFYANFWHQLMRKGFTSNAGFLVTHVLGLSARTPIARYLTLFVSFIIVAVLHILASPAPFRCSIWPQVRYYGSIACAIVVEDAVMALALKVRQHFLRKEPKGVLEVRPKEGNPGVLDNGDGVEQRGLNSTPIDLFPARNWRMVGYVWVALFDMWATSKLVYAAAACR